MVSLNAGEGHLGDTFDPINVSTPKEPQIASNMPKKDVLGNFPSP